jgi:hypothetical protein
LRLNTDHYRRIPEADNRDGIEIGIAKEGRGRSRSDRGKLEANSCGSTTWLSVTTCDECGGDRVVWCGVGLVGA